MGVVLWFCCQQIKRIFDEKFLTQKLVASNHVRIRVIGIILKKYFLSFLIKFFVKKLNLLLVATSFEVKNRKLNFFFIKLKMKNFVKLKIKIYKSFLFEKLFLQLKKNWIKIVN